MSEASRTWRNKLDYLQQQEAIVSDPAQKFTLAEQIKEAKVKIAELEAMTVTYPASAPGVFHADISRIDKYAPAKLIGREVEMKLLSDAWDMAIRDEKERPHVVTFVALGGEGKTSLVAKWAAELAYQNWRGCETAFAWSFYSQGTREQMAASSDFFLKEALTFFGDPEMAGSAQGAFDKGGRLAQLVGERRALLMLDGLEPLQYAPTSPTPGELKDQGLTALFKGLAAHNHGLCVVTTRYSIRDLRAYWQTTAPEVKLTRLSKEAGVALLHSLGVKGAQKEFETLVEDVSCHALTLSLLGSYLRDAHGGDIRKRDLVKLEEADTEEQGGHAFRVMDSYVQSFASEGERGQRALALLRLLGLFDRPASCECLATLLKAPVIPGLTEALVGMSEVQRNLAVTRLEAASLLTVNRDAAGQLLALDAHPLLREYFSNQLRTDRPEAWRAAHRRLYEYLCATTPDKPKPTLEDLEPLYQAVAHGCQAGMQQEACEMVYRDRILRGKEDYPRHQLGAYSVEVGIQACFFEQPWSRFPPLLTEAAQAWLLNEAAFCLRALGRLKEALEPMRASLKIRIERQEWEEVPTSASNLSELELALGEVAEAVGNAELCVTWADRSGTPYWKVASHAKLANALHQAGRRAAAETRFREAEAQQVERNPPYTLLYSVKGFHYCDLLLAAAERAAWQVTVDPSFITRPSSLLESCHAVSQRAAKMFEWRAPSDPLLDVALDQLTLGRAVLYKAILDGSSLHPCYSSLQHAVDGLRRAGRLDQMPLGLLSHAWLNCLTGLRTKAQAGLDEAWEIAELCPMPLYLTDIHLHRARLFFREKTYPWKSPENDLAEARRLIEKHGYLRRKEELEDAERVIF